MVAAVLTFKKPSITKRDLVNKCVNWLFLRLMFRAQKSHHHLFQMTAISVNSLPSVTPCPSKIHFFAPYWLYLPFSTSVSHIHLSLCVVSLVGGKEENCKSGVKDFSFSRYREAISITKPLQCYIHIWNLSNWFIKRTVRVVKEWKWSMTRNVQVQMCEQVPALAHTWWQSQWPNL